MDTLSSIKVFAVNSQDPEVVELATLHTARTGTWIQSVIGLLDIASRHLEDSKVAAQSAIEQASALLQDQMRPRPRPRTGARASRGLLKWELRKLREYVDAHIADRVFVSELGAVVGLSEAHFSRCFTQTLGLSPHVFVMRRRVELAAQLMLESAASLTEIALRCGFTDQAHLCNQFRKLVGETPRAWRCSNQGEIGLVARARVRREPPPARARVPKLRSKGDLDTARRAVPRSSRLTPVPWCTQGIEQRGQRVSVNRGGYSLESPVEVKPDPQRGSANVSSSQRV